MFRPHTDLVALLQITAKGDADYLSVVPSPESDTLPRLLLYSLQRVHVALSRQINSLTEVRISNFS